MFDTIFLVVQFAYRTHKFLITSQMHANDIQQKIGRYFHINMEKFLLEIFDKHFNLYFIFDEAYLDKLQRNSNITTDNSLTARIRSLHQSRYNIQFDTFALEETSTGNSKFFFFERIYCRRKRERERERIKIS